MAFSKQRGTYKNSKMIVNQQISCAFHSALQDRESNSDSAVLSPFFTHDIVAAANLSFRSRSALPTLSSGI